MQTETESPRHVGSSALLAGEPATHKPLLDRIAEMREICRWSGDMETAKLLDEAGRTIDEMWNELLAYGYATDVLRRECGLPINSENLSDVYDYICELKAKICQPT